MHTVYPKKHAHGFCFAVLCCGYTLTDFPISIRLIHWHCGNLTFAPVPAKQPWWIWINTSCEFIMNDCITTTKQSTTKPCVYFLEYTVLLKLTLMVCIVFRNFKSSLWCVSLSFVIVKTYLYFGVSLCAIKSDFVVMLARASLCCEHHKCSPLMEVSCCGHILVSYIRLMTAIDKPVAIELKPVL